MPCVWNSDVPTCTTFVIQGYCLQSTSMSTYQVAKLKQSRDKLLEEIDSQWEEMDRMAAEGRATVEELGEQRRLAAAWELQAQVWTQVQGGAASSLGYSYVYSHQFTNSYACNI